MSSGELTVSGLNLGQMVAGEENMVWVSLEPDLFITFILPVLT